MKKAHSNRDHSSYGGTCPTNPPAPASTLPGSTSESCVAGELPKVVPKGQAFRLILGLKQNIIYISTFKRVTNESPHTTKGPPARTPLQGPGVYSIYIYINDMMRSAGAVRTPWNGFPPRSRRNRSGRLLGWPLRRKPLEVVARSTY